MWEPRKKWDRNRPIILKFGIVCALGLVLMAFNIKTEITENPEYIVESLPIEIDVIRTSPDKKKKVLPPPKPPEPIITDIPDDTEFIDEKPPEPKPVIDPKPNSKPVEIPEPISHDPVLVDPPVVIVPIMKPEVPIGPLVFAQRMPVFGDCEFMEEDERRACSSEQLIEYVYDKVRYPNAARLAGAEGAVVARFIVDIDGQITNLEIIRDFGFGSAKEVRRVIENMPDWKPGKQNGRRVPVIMTLPVKFTLKKG